MSPVDLYLRLIFRHTYLFLSGFFLLLVIAAVFTGRFELDASGESLVLENDQSLNYYREISQRYASDDFVVITFTPIDDLLSDDSLDVIRSIKERLLTIPGITGVTSILDVPVIYESGKTLSELSGELYTLGHSNVDKELARKEFMNNPLYRGLLVSKDGSTTAIQAHFKQDKAYLELINQRQQWQQQGNDAEAQKLTELIHDSNRQLSREREADIAAIRGIIDDHRQHGQFYLGGIPMITVDMINYIKNDLLVFGTGVLAFLLLILTFFFRQLRWVAIPLAVCASTAVITIGFLGMVGWPVTVISSNFLSILLIITLSLTIHLIVRFRDLQLEQPETSYHEHIQSTVNSMLRPCFYTVLTTIVAFMSLVVSEIRPVIDFGWIMVVGLCIAFLVAFSLLPALLGLMHEPRMPPAKDLTRRITLMLAGLVSRYPVVVMIIGIVLILGVGSGIPLLKVENRFINNFKADTEIYQGMRIIDNRLGGTMPLDIIIDPDSLFLEAQQELSEQVNDMDMLFMDESEKVKQASYWLNPAVLEKGQKLQQYLESMPVIGKVISIVTTVNIVEKINGEPLDEFELTLLRKRIPGNIEETLVAPYLSADGNQARFSMRIIESDPTLNRQELLQSINSFLVDELELEPEQVHLTGMMVLYNNMLQSLFKSQILTIGAVFAAIFLMFLLLFRDLSLAAIAIVPNLFSAVIILGLMGILGIPLDMMTITIAAITIGISVDNTIHYIHRLQREYPKDHDYLATIQRCHGSIGKAMYYTSLAIMFGFAILALSNFIPTIYFGLLTGFAMFVALVGDLLLLPAIILLTRPKIH
ncbi:MAG: MMPL family transporter [Gammaproteobacteria bacterium]